MVSSFNFFPNRQKDLYQHLGDSSDGEPLTNNQIDSIQKLQKLCRQIRLLLGFSSVLLMILLFPTLKYMFQPAEPACGLTQGRHADNVLLAPECKHWF